MPEHKKTAARNPSAPTDRGQLSTKYMDSIAENPAADNPYTEKTTPEMAEHSRLFAQMQDPDYLYMMDMDTLMEKTFPVKEAVIDHLLYKGVYLFAGAPKIGKSFLVLQIAYAISTGQPLWEYPVHPGPVLYLALEDHYQRLQERMARMFGVDGKGELLLAVTAKQIGQGLEKQMEYFLKQYPNARLIIIDTLQKVREAAGDRYSYASDYEIIGQMKTFADHHNICILIVHHTRKQQAEDSFEMISGTTGILDIVGRDQPDQRLRLLRNEETLAWMFESADRELWKAPSDPLLEQVARLVTPEQPVWHGTATELVALLPNDLTPIGVVKRLNSRASRLYADYGIRYETSRRHDGRSLTLTLESSQA